jgi:hypothetical protein
MILPVHGLQLLIMPLMYIVLNSINADIKSEFSGCRWGLRPYPLRFHVKEAGTGAKLIQHGPKGPTIVGIQFILSQLQGLQHL